MAVLPILITGEPVLHSLALPVTEFTDDLRELVDDMFETMEAAPGVGLAGPQVGQSLQLFVYNWVDDDNRLWRGVAINPELWLSSPMLGDADEDEDSEGCLSVPGERFPLLRAEHVILRALNLEQEPFEIVAHGWLARIFQHEFDHLNGVLYVDRLEHAWRKPAAKAIKSGGWGMPGKRWMPGVDNLDA